MHNITWDPFAGYLKHRQPHKHFDSLVLCKFSQVPPLKKTNTKKKSYRYQCKWKLEKFGEGVRVISLHYIKSVLAHYFNVLSLHLSKRSDSITSNRKKRKETEKRTTTHKTELFSHITTKTDLTKITTSQLRKMLQLWGHNTDLSKPRAGGKLSVLY